MSKKLYFLLIITIAFSSNIFAGNPDRQGEAGAYQLLLNPWARSAGLNAAVAASGRGVEAMNCNVAGLSRINKTEILFGSTRYLVGSDISINALGLAQKMGKNGALGISFTTVNVGDIDVTTVAQPEGTGATYRPNIFNLGISYSHTFANKVSVGLTFRSIIEGTANLSAFGLAMDAGVQYVAGEDDNFKLGVVLRNIGTPMRFSGQGLSVQQTNPAGVLPYNLTYNQRAAAFQLPSMLMIGGAYDIKVSKNHKVTMIGNFTSNSFSRDDLTFGMEYDFADFFALRGSYRYEVGSQNVEAGQRSVYTGVAGGLSVNVPLKKASDSMLGIDYAYLATSPFNGTHQISLRLSL